MAEDQKTPWTVSVDPDSAVVKLSGEVDFTNSLDVRDWLKEQVQRSSGDLLLDLAELSYIDSSGLAILIEIRKLLRGRERAIRVTAVSSQVQKLFTLTQIGELFGI